MATAFGQCSGRDIEFRVVKSGHGTRGRDSGRVSVVVIFRMSDVQNSAPLWTSLWAHSVREKK